MPMFLSTSLLSDFVNLATLVVPAVRAGAMGKFSLAAVVTGDKRNGAELVMYAAAITPTL